MAILELFDLIFLPKYSRTMRRLYVQSDEVAEGKMFVAFIALIVRTYMQNQLSDYMSEHKFTFQKILAFHAKLVQLRFGCLHFSKIAPCQYDCRCFTKLLANCLSHAAMTAGHNCNCFLHVFSSRLFHSTGGSEWDLLFCVCMLQIDQKHVQPPSQVIMVPFTKWESSLARNSAALAISSGIPISGEWVSRELVRSKPNSFA